MVSISDIALPGGSAPSAGLQESDINDGDILAGTYYEPGPNETIYYCVNLPDGRIYKFGPVPEHQRREANRQWLANVRSQLILAVSPEKPMDEPDSVEEAALRLKRQLELEGEGLVLEGHREPEMARKPPSTPPAQKGENQPWRDDPVRFARDQLSRLLTEIAEIDEQILRLQSKKKAAEAALKVWSKMAGATKKRKSRRPSKPRQLPIVFDTSSESV
jgi:hypothetical protein